MTNEQVFATETWRRREYFLILLCVSVSLWLMTVFGHRDTEKKTGHEVHDYTITSREIIKNRIRARWYHNFPCGTREP